MSFRFNRAAVLSAILAATVLAGSACTAARRPYTAPTPVMPDNWSRETIPAAVPGSPAGTATVDTAWWTTFGDPQLVRLVERAIAANLDVHLALSRIREARARLRVTRTDRSPSVTIGASTTASRSPSENAAGREISVQRDYQTSADASWEADIVGGIHSAIDASAATLDATSADLDNVVVTLAADVGTTYIRIRSLQERLTVAAANEAAQADSYDLTRFRQQAGLTTQLDVEQARASLESTRAQMASLRLDEAQTTHALAILLAEPPTSLDAELMDSRPVPTAPLSLAIGIPADVLRRRPDVRSAERRLAAQDAEVNVARASLYPRLTLTGSIGLETLNIAKWFVPGAAFWRLGPSVNLAAFDRTRIRQNIVIQDELRVQAALDYESRVLTALSEVEDALVALGEESERRDRLVEAAAAAQQASDLALQMYSAGLRDFRDVLDAQRSLLSIQDSLASSRANLSTDLVRLYRSAGGGWSILSAP